MHHRNEALEQAIIDSPDDPAPRLVYGDWLQAVGDVRGEWMTLSAAIAANPDDTRLRSAALAFLAGHRRELLGDGAKLVNTSWFGWHTGSRAAIADALLEMFRALPALRRLRLIELRGTDALLARLDLGRFERLDLSHCDLTAAAPLLEAPPGMQILALHTRFSPGDRAKLTARGAIVSTGDSGSFYELTDEGEERSWIAHRVRTEGRAAVRLVPTAGVLLYNLGTIHVHRNRLEEARPLIERLPRHAAPGRSRRGGRRARRAARREGELAHRRDRRARARHAR